MTMMEETLSELKDQAKKITGSRYGFDILYQINQVDSTSGN